MVKRKKNRKRRRLGERDENIDFGRWVEEKESVKKIREEIVVEG